MIKKIEERLSDPNNLNPLFQRIGGLANVHFEKMTSKLLSVRSNIFSLVGGSVLAEILDREPDPYRAKSKSVTKWLLGSYGENMECWSSPSGQKFILITNGYRVGNKKRKIFEMFPVRKQDGMWIEYDEPIKP